MAKSGGQNRKGEAPDHAESDDRPRTGYRARGQGLQALPNSDLMPAPADSARASNPRVITPEGTGSSGAGSSKMLIIGGIVVAVLAVGGFLAQSGGDQTDTGTVVAEADPVPTENETLAAVTTPVAEPDVAPVAEAPAEPVINETEETAETVVATPEVEAPALPAMENITVVLYQFASSTPWEAAANLRTLGVGAVAMSEAAIPVAQNQVRFYSTDDQDAATALAERYEAALVDLSWYSPAPATATLDLWLAE